MNILQRRAIMDLLVSFVLGLFAWSCSAAICLFVLWVAGSGCASTMKAITGGCDEVWGIERAPLYMDAELFCPVGEEP